jgi:hypothetical protein
MSSISAYKTWCVLHWGEGNGEPSIYDINIQNNTEWGRLEMLRQEKHETKEWRDSEFQKWLESKPPATILTIKEFVKQSNLESVIQFCKLKGWKNFSILDENHKKVF